MRRLDRLDSISGEGRVKAADIDQRSGMVAHQRPDAARHGVVIKTPYRIYGLGRAAT
jgi:hypothetical protein